MTAEVLAFGPACSCCGRRGVPMSWQIPIAGPDARAYCNRRACKAERDRWMTGKYPFITGPVRGVIPPGWGAA